mmetsp:Transcript_99608/g.281072  ORF Transcript_99608/g.281072 Transcript_99608/m.281072 type:complete len:275 (-) Transcript_99608:500-1324(-)
MVRNFHCVHYHCQRNRSRNRGRVYDAAPQRHPARRFERHPVGLLGHLLRRACPSLCKRRCHLFLHPKDGLGVELLRFFCGLRICVRAHGRNATHARALEGVQRCEDDPCLAGRTRSPRHPRLTHCPRHHIRAGVTDAHAFDFRHHAVTCVGPDVALPHHVHLRHHIHASRGRVHDGRLHWGHFGVELLLGLGAELHGDIAHGGQRRPGLGADHVRFGRGALDLVHSLHLLRRLHHYGCLQQHHSGVLPERDRWRPVRPGAHDPGVDHEQEVLRR